MLKYVPWNWLIRIEPHFLKLIPDDLKAQEMWNKVVVKVPWLLHYVPVRRRTHEMCERATEKFLHPFRLIPDYLKTQKCVKKLLKMNQNP